MLLFSANAMNISIEPADHMENFSDMPSSKYAAEVSAMMALATSVIGENFLPTFTLESGSAVGVPGIEIIARADHGLANADA